MLLFEIPQNGFYLGANSHQSCLLRIHRCIREAYLFFTKTKKTFWYPPKGPGRIAQTPHMQNLTLSVIVRVTRAIFPYLPLVFMKMLPPSDIGLYLAKFNLEKDLRFEGECSYFEHWVIPHPKSSCLWETGVLEVGSLSYQRPWTSRNFMTTHPDFSAPVLVMSSSCASTIDLPGPPPWDAPSHTTSTRVHRLGLETWHSTNISQSHFKHTVYQPQTWFIGPLHFVLNHKYR